MTPSRSNISSVEEQIALLQKLAASLSQAQTALLQSDVHALEENTQLQNRMCEQLRRLQTSSAAGTMAPGDDPGGGWHELSAKLVRAESEVRHLNAVYAALLRRAQRSVQITQNLLRNLSGTYHSLDAHPQPPMFPHVRS